MSVQQNTYVMYAVKLPGDGGVGGDDMWDVVEPYTDNPFEPVVPHNGLTVVFDGMCGKYTFIGRVLSRSDECGGLEPISPYLTRLECNKVKALITEHFGIESPDVRFWVFTHYR